MKKYVIYTVMVGGYDEILQPLIVDNRFEYVLFSNDFAEKQIGIWQVRPIPIDIGIAQGDNKRLSRYPKTHPEMMLNAYNASLYIDANIQIVDQWVYNRFVNLVEKNIEFAGIKLQLTGRDCTYEHAYDICNRAIEHDDVAIKQCHLMYKDGFPRHFGLNENNVLFRKHTAKMRQVDEEWWWWIMHYSFRDQFSYMYVLWKYRIPLYYFLPEDEATECTTHFKRISHDNQNRNTKILKMKYWEMLRLRSRTLNKRTNSRYLKHWMVLLMLPCPELWQKMWGVMVGLFNLPHMLYRKIMMMGNHL